MRYVPESDDAGVHGPYWNAVVEGILERLIHEPLLRSAKPGPLRLIRDLRSIPDRFEDRHGEPLFADITPELYISPRYASADLETLCGLGLRKLNIRESLDRVRCDLESSSSRLRTSTDEAWHSCVAKLLILPFTRNLETRITRVKALKLIPLKDGTWMSSNNGPVYYPETSGGLTIPDDIGLRLISPAACSNKDRNELFELLGVSIARDDLVRETTFEKYKAPFPFLNIVTPETSMDHLRFLYLSHHRAKDHSEYEHLFIMTNKKDERADPFWSDTYLPTEEEYGAFKLLSPTPAGPGVDDGAPGFDVPFLHDIYLQDKPDRPNGEDLCWTEWLSQFLNLRTEIKLTEEDEDQLSSASLYVAEHRPSKFLGFLRSSWDERLLWRTRIKPSLRFNIRMVKVLCQDGVLRELENTFIPTESAKQLAGRFLDQEGSFPWLQLEKAPSHATFPLEWEPLTRDLECCLVGAEHETELDFCLDILDYLALSEDPESRESISLSRRVYDLYLFLEAQVRASVDKSAAVANVRQVEPEPFRLVETYY